LADAVQNDFGAPVIQLDRPVNFDDASCQAADVAYIFKVDRKRLGRLLFAELNEMHAFSADLHIQKFSGYAFRFTDVLLGAPIGRQSDAAHSGVGEQNGESH
jgi:hypothetical protein